MTAGLVAQAFILSDLDIDNHLRAAVDRTCIAGNLVLVGLVWSWAVVAIAALRPPASAASKPERAAGSTQHLR
jgi:hypothetical protein